jgi:small ubiquitin-related modifier
MPFRKIFAAFADKKGISVNSLRFAIDGTRINEDDTPRGLDLDEDDQIDCFLEQTGGGGRGFNDSSMM